MTSGLLIIAPAWNEEGAIGGVVRSVRQILPDTPILVVDDHSDDATASIAERSGASVLRLPIHLGLGGCVQAAYKLAFELGYEYVIRVDGDGQHPAEEIPKIYDALVKTGYEVVIGSRFVGADHAHTSVARSVGINFFRAMLKPILGKPIHDPTSGFVGVNRRALQVFSRTFPLAWPEIEVLVVLQRRRFRFCEVPCAMKPRATGKSSITPVKSIQYMLHVLLGVFVNVLKADPVARRPRSS
ncbi:MAG TPA: glycosyltransferase family 2 protein [Bryobacteraceae bacterium]|nr:glycosyltransferase family 2 protein [Bryobacteraceae bacterium]